MTQAVHAGEHAERSDFRGSGTPIYNSTTFIYDKMQDLDDIIQRKRSGYVYARYGNPTNAALERALATLEGADVALSCGSGMAACQLAFLGAGVGAGDLVVSSADVYGATHLLIDTLLPRLGLRVKSLDFGDLGELERVLDRERPKALFFEAVTNPLLRVLDAPAIVELARRHGVTTIVDNTFTTPMLLKPFEFGADWVVHSVTKFLSGHGDVLAGAVLCHESDFDMLYSMMLQVGPTLGPNEAYLALRGLKTFPLRFERHCANALELARFLEGHPRVEQVYYPGLHSHPQHDLAKRILNRGLFGPMVSFEMVDGDRQRAFRLLEALCVMLPATTLGDVYSTILYPARSSHAGLSDDERRRIGITPGLLRCSVGIEDVEDLKDDLDQALRAAYE